MILPATRAGSLGVQVPVAAGETSAHVPLVKVHVTLSPVVVPVRAVFADKLAFFGVQSAGLVGADAADVMRQSNPVALKFAGTALAVHAPPLAAVQAVAGTSRKSCAWQLIRSPVTSVPFVKAVAAGPIVSFF